MCKQLTPHARCATLGLDLLKNDVTPVWSPRRIETTMNTISLGHTGVQVSQLCYGTMAFGGDADESTSAALYKRCREAGINFFDCANVYAGGRSETILGKLSKHERDELVLTSKVCGRVGPGANDRGLSRRHIHAQIEVSLRRLQTDRLDIYFIHNLDAETPIEETLRALDDLVHAGKILYVGVSNWAAWQISRALGVSARESLTSFACLQPMYNLAKRQAEVEILPMAQHEGLGVISYSPVGVGLLSGKYGIRERPDHGRLIETPTYQKRYGDEANYEIAERFVDHARELGEHPVSLAVAWVMAHPAVTTPIIGARSVEQLEPSLAAVDVEMSAERYAAISALSPPPPPATDRTEDQL